MNPPWVYTCSPSWTPLPPPSPYHPFGSSQCTSPKHPESCIEPGLAIRFTYDIIHVSMPFSQIIPLLPSPIETRRLFYTSVSLLLSLIQGYRYHLSKFHIYALVLGAGGEGDDRGWDGWMASLTRWAWVWVNSGSWWWTGRPGVLWFMGSQRVRHDWATDLIWSDTVLVFFFLAYFTLYNRLQFHPSH